MSSSTGFAKKPDVIIVGASARAAAASAIRGGLTPWTLDLFGDADLRALCEGEVIPRPTYPRAIPALLAKHAPYIPCMYTGGLENHPAVLDEILNRRPLWGCSPAAVRGVRDPFRVAEVLSSRGCRTPRLARHDDSLLADRTRWIIKPRIGAGGRRIAFQGSAPTPSDCFLQEYRPGQSIAALFLADGESATLLGATLQLVGEAWLHAQPFHYCGSVGPIDLAPHYAEQVSRIGNALASQFQLMGLFGIDCIIDEANTWLIEVNPRYTASTEILEMAGGESAVALHAAVCSGSPRSISAWKCAYGFIGKAILFARRDLVFLLPWNTFAMPDFADVPPVGSSIPAGWPILTCFAKADSIDKCLGLLRRRAESLDRLLYSR